MEVDERGELRTRREDPQRHPPKARSPILNHAAVKQNRVLTIMLIDAILSTQGFPLIHESDAIHLRARASPEEPSDVQDGFPSPLRINRYDKNAPPASDCFS